MSDTQRASNTADSGPKNDDDVHVEVTRIVGFGSVSESLFVDGTKAALIVQETDQRGQAIGAYETALPPDTVRHLEPFVAKVAAANETIERDGAAWSVRWRSGSRVVDATTDLLPTSEAGRALRTEIEKLLVILRKHPRALLQLQVVAPSSLQVGEPARYLIRLVNGGTEAVTVAFPSGGPWLEAAPFPFNNPTWKTLGNHAGPLARTVIGPGKQFDFPVSATLTEKGGVAVLANFQGDIEMVGIPHIDGPFFTRLQSQYVQANITDR